MSEWKKVKLGEITQIIDGDRGKNYPKNNEFSNVGYCLFLNTGNVTKEGFTFENNQFISKEKDNLLRKGKIQRGDLILTTRGTVGNIGFYDNHIKYDNIRINSGMVILRVIKDIVDAQFLYQLIRGNECRTYIKSFCTGSAQPQLPIKNLSQIDIKIPHLLTQHRIATILSRYDSLIENYQKQIKLLEEAAQRLYKEWFVDLHFPGYETTKIIDGVPEGWEKKKVGAIGKVITGKTPSTAKKENYGGKIPFITIPDMHTGIYPTSSQFLSDLGANSQSGKFIPVNSLMVSCIGTAGLVCITNEECQTNQQINSLVLNDISQLYYLYNTFLSLKEYLNNIGSNGATMTNVNKSKFESIEILIPPNSISNLYNKAVEPSFRSIKTFSSQIRLLTEARDRLLPKLMSGDIKIESL